MVDMSRKSLTTGNKEERHWGQKTEGRVTQGI